mgnify:CR=1 FL=1
MVRMTSHFACREPLLGSDRERGGKKPSQKTKKPLAKEWLICFFKKLRGAPGAIRTPDPLVRSQVLYPTELRAQRNLEAANSIDEVRFAQAFFEFFCIYFFVSKAFCIYDATRVLQ